LQGRLPVEARIESPPRGSLPEKRIGLSRDHQMLWPVFEPTDIVKSDGDFFLKE